MLLTSSRENGQRDSNVLPKSDDCLDDHEDMGMAESVCCRSVDKVPSLLVSVCLIRSKPERSADKDGSVHINDTWWLMVYTLLVPILNLLPSSWKKP